MGALKKAKHTLWTFRVSGGTAFGIEITANPHVEHQGGTSIFHWVLTPEEVEIIEDIATRRGCKVDRWLPDGESEDQKKERRALLNQQDRVWPCAQCPECAWFDPVISEDVGEPCGLTGWDESAVKAFKKNKKALADIEACESSHIPRVA